MPRAAVLSIVCLAVAAGGCAVTPPEEDPVQIKLRDVDTRLARIERVVANQSLLDMANQIEAVRNDVRSLHNDIDLLNHNLDASRKQQRDLYADLDQRMKSVEGRGGVAGGTVPSGVAGAGAGAAGDVNEKVSYQAAFDLLKENLYNRAVAAFQSFLRTYPSSQLADNAQYWLGEAYYVNKSFPEALAAFQRVVEVYPQSRKIPDALLKMGYCNYELKRFPAARDVLNQVAIRFPDTPAGGMAKQRLDKMSAEKL